MHRPTDRWTASGLWALLLIAVLALALTACGSGAEPTPTPTSTPTSTPVPTGTPPSPTVAPPDEPLTLELLSPRDGAGVEIDAVRVLGVTRPDAAVAVNGIPVDVAANGTFQRDLFLEPGPNLVQVVAADLFGSSVSESVVVFFVAPASGLPLSLLYPEDGTQASESSLTLIGGTRPDAVVGVNGIPVDVNAFGIFSTDLALEEGANLIEIVATDIEGNVNFQTVVVFYLP